MEPHHRTRPTESLKLPTSLPPAKKSLDHHRVKIRLKSLGCRTTYACRQDGDRGGDWLPDRARPERERGASYTKYTCGCGRRTRRVRRSSRRFWSVRQTTDERSRGGEEERTNERRTNRYHKGDSGKGYTTGPDDETTKLNDAVGPHFCSKKD